jgi:hypothetical protein
MMLFASDFALPTPPTSDPGCIGAQNPWCDLFFQLTAQGWLSRTAGVLLDGTLKMLLIVGLAMVIRSLCHRAIQRVARGIGEGGAPSALRRCSSAPSAGRARTQV